MLLDFDADLAGIQPLVNMAGDGAKDEWWKPLALYPTHPARLENVWTSNPFMIRSLLFMLALVWAFSEEPIQAQPMPTSGSNVTFLAVCPNCYVESVLVARKIKVLKIKKELGGSIHYLSITFMCPKCEKPFTSKGTKWVRDAQEVAVPPKEKDPPPLPKKEAKLEPLQKAKGWQLPWNRKLNFNNHFTEDL